MERCGRWHLACVRVRGFKSFGASWVSAPLPSPHLVGILGPNGSGKSNLLEAVLFAAGCPATTLRVRTLRELASSDAADSPCEVEVTLQRHAAGASGGSAAAAAASATARGGRRGAQGGSAPAAAGSTGGSGGGRGGGGGALESHVLRASLAPDGSSRVFHIDGRAKTAQQVKEFLAARGLALDGGAAAAGACPRVIRQAQVTTLADSNDPASLAALVGSASGLVRWQEQTRRGREELEATRGALREIRGNLDRLQAAVRGDEERLAAASRLASLELQVAGAGAELGRALARWAEHIQVDIKIRQRRQDETQGEVNRLEADAAVAEAQHRQLAAELEGLMAVEAAADAAAAAAAAAAAPPAGPGSGQGGFGAGGRRRRRQASAASAQPTSAPPGTTAVDGGAAPPPDVGAPPSAATAAALEQLLAVEVEKVKLFERQLAEARRLREVASAAAARQAGAASALGAASEAVEREAGKLEETEALLEGMVAAADAAAAAAVYEGHLRAAATEAAAAAAAARERRAAAEADARRAEEALAAARLEAARRQSSRAAQPDAAAAATAADAAAAAVEHAAAAVQATQRELAQIRVRAEALRRALQLPTPPTASVPYRRLYQCFSFRPQSQTGPAGGGAWPPPPAAEPTAADVDGDNYGDADGDDGEGWAVQPWPSYLRALSVIGGASLQVLVCDNAAAAARVADDPRLAAVATSAGGGAASWLPPYSGGGGGKLRIWPLDRLRCTDLTASQRRAQAELAADGLQAWLPLDLLYGADPRVGPALQRAFGRFMVAADDAAAAALAARFGLSSVTLAGSVSHRGALTGGWDDGGGGGGGPAAASRQLLERMWELSELGRLESRLSARLARQRARADAAERRRVAAEAAALEAVAEAEAARAARGRLDELTQRLAAAAEERDAAAAAVASAAQEDERNQRALQDHLRRSGGAGGGEGGGGGGGGAGGSAREALVAEVAALRARVEELTAARRDAQAASEAAEADVEVAEARAASAVPPAEAAARLEERRRVVQDMERRLSEVRAALEEAARRRRELGARVAAAGDLVSDLRAEHQARAAALRSGQEALNASRASLMRVAQERDTVRHEYGGTAVTGTTMLAASASPGTDEAASPPTEVAEPQERYEDAAADLRRRLRALKAERSKLDGSQVPPAQLAQFQDRVAAVATLRERATSLATAVDMLQRAITDSAASVLAANTAVFNAVRRRFVSLCGRLLPSLNLDLGTPHGCASRGVAVRFRRRHPNGGFEAAAPGHEVEWSDELGQLSGGQRTLVSVALLLSVALAVGPGGGASRDDGGGGGGLFLLDEVDAALDEHNQSAVAALLRHLSHRGAGCQVLAVTHNAAFQAACEAHVRVSRGSAGTQVDAGGVGTAAAAAAPARGGPSDPRVGGPTPGPLPAAAAKPPVPKKPKTTAGARRM